MIINFDSIKECCKTIEDLKKLDSDFRELEGGMTE